MTRILEPGRNCERISKVATSGVLFDARDYYVAVYDAIASAESYVLITGWQFDTGVALLRGADVKRAERAELPVHFLELLERVVKLRPNLEIFILAWDFSFVFAFEREWMQRAKFSWMTSAQIHFVFDAQHPTMASHHQKLVVVDGAIAFAGGIDLCESRWDDRAHAPNDDKRVNRDATPQKPYHDLMAYCTGPVVRDLEKLFCLRWQRATDDKLVLPEHTGCPPEALENAQPIDCKEVALSLTFGAHPPSSTAKVEQIKALHEDAIASAERLIYIETQYFTSRAVHAAFSERMQAERSKLEIVIVMPVNADTPKEHFAIGETQDWVLASLSEIARKHGHDLRILYSAAQDESGNLVATFIHSKLLIVDDRFLTLGSANCTNRSMSFDSELNFVWECNAEPQPLSKSIARTRASLICEHAGIEHDAALESSTGIVAQIDELIGQSKLHLRDVPASSKEIAPTPLIEHTFDPDRNFSELELDDLIA